MTKQRIINDPLYGFISVSGELILELIEHSYFQRLRHIRQLGMSHFVFPGAEHSRFQHALGSMHLMRKILQQFRVKGIEISEHEMEAAMIAALLHDIGHGPLSHSLEQTLLHEVPHESLSYQFMKTLNHTYGGALDLAIRIFRNTYERKFFHQLVSGQLDVDRWDYLIRDSYYCGVPEGRFGVDRLITVMTVKDDQVAVEENGLHSVESFLHARRYMYWEVYLHKTAVSAERMMVNIFKRAQYLTLAGESLPCTEALKVFLTKNYSVEDFSDQLFLLETFGSLDDHDVWGAVKLWKNHTDTILSGLCARILQRKLFAIEMTDSPIQKEKVEKIRRTIHQSFGILMKDTPYLFSQGVITNEAYVEGKPIFILTKKGKLEEVAERSDLSSIKAIGKVMKKHFLCWPKSITL